MPRANSVQPPPALSRAVLCVDFDKFFAALEEARRPELKGRPVVVCVYSGRGQGGAVSTANYEARTLGIKSGMPISSAMQLGKDAAFLPVDKQYYGEMSDKIMEHFRTLANTEQASVDEAYLEVDNFQKAAQLATEIKNWVKENIHITCTIGIAANKLVAKMACDAAKPDGLKVIEQGKEEEFLHPLPIGKLFLVGPKTEELLKKEGIQTVKDMSQLSSARLQELFGPARGHYFFQAARGIDDSPVQEEPEKSYARMGTLQKDTREKEEVEKFLDLLADSLEERVRASGVSFRHIGIVAITPSLKPFTKSRTLPQSIPFPEARRLFKELMEEFLAANPQAKLRRAGISVGWFDQQKAQGLHTFFSKTA